MNTMKDMADNLTMIAETLAGGDRWMVLEAAEALRGAVAFKAEPDASLIGDGGPAFPQPGLFNDDGGTDYPIDDGMGGMSRRDWFAGMIVGHVANHWMKARIMAIAGVASGDPDTFLTKDDQDRVWGEMVFEIADAMLAASERGPRPPREA